MAIELRIPEVGESITEVQIARWLKAEGDAVQKDEPVAVIDSEKTTFDLPAPEGGTLTTIRRQAGETVAIGEVIGQMDVRSAPSQPESGAKPDPDSAPAARTRTEKTESPASGPGTPPHAPAPSENAGRETTEALAQDSERTEDGAGESKARAGKAADTAGEGGGSMSAPKTSPGPGTESAAEPTGTAEEETVPMSMLRRTVARRLVEAKQQMAMLTTFNEVDMSVIQALRREHQEAFEKRHQVKLGLMSFFVRAAVDALKQIPQLNAEVRGHDIVHRRYFNVGVAISTGRGLVVPVLNRAERLSFADVEKAIGVFAARAREGKLTPPELEGATFTITNGGVFGSLLSTPIINPPQSGILGLHTIQDRPVAVQGQVVIRPMMYLALTYDHRIVDGREAVLFLRRIKEVIETPARLLLEI